MVQMTIRLDPTRAEQLAAVAAVEGKSRAQLLNEIIERWALDRGTGDETQEALSAAKQARSSRRGNRKS